MKPNIVFVINYFHPDYASTGQILTDLCMHLQHDFNITVIAELPPSMKDNNNRKKFHYDELEKIKIIRIQLPEVDKTSKLSRLRYIASYFFNAVYILLKQRDMQFIYTISQPPVLGGLIGSIGKILRGSKHIYNIQDFNPEQAEAVGYNKSKLLVGVARWVDKMNCRLADHVITVGYDMRETLERRFKNRNVPSNSVINNWTDEKDIVPLDKTHPEVSQFLDENDLQDKFIVMYSGNLGLYYDLENLIKFTERFKECPDLMFVFIGEGAVKHKMMSFVKEQQITQVKFLGFQDKSRIKYSLNAADIHLVVNQKGIKGVSVPSKIYGVMAAGKPVFGVLEDGSEAFRLVEESKCGVLVEPQQYDEFVEKVKQMYFMKNSELFEMGMRGRSYLDQNLRREVAMDKYRTLLHSLTSEPNAKQKGVEMNL
ncbi:glycosyltransferase family 4 protein [Paenibacillus sp. Marseille-Q4541]|uniref:glycosyltransferase family 4 protein n=1 Tax=Paenibacillus sp. Marseille-Q4541 TaxID=2831522 RepID=UPI001BABD574|nr:glycosyltransferase family 4 protein [Paenibacillus sp. Marseille-Q4541]